ncbi:hypothetical protein MOO46_02965 [Apilactobacillus apisilvae]|uniref:Competence protein CoiA n=1 Tax=Apilactobacillus apisilvae TaxID=2923364 RepID=A0ABY4PII7_9LACO|nr:competence protein CoiA family protein [Apilactobacillus apisilvae]UQS85559.1 hypothetical protein MOO46_02965 [Apilactobacillus apisilvae]
MLIAKKGTETVMSIYANKNNDYYCPICLSKVILKECKNKVNHFSHFSNSDCPNLHENESSEHIKGKLQILKFINNKNTKMEYYIPCIKQRPDLINKNIAFEFQCSPISSERLKERIAGYKKINIHSLWILGSNYLKHFGNINTNKFFYYSKNLGFYIMFWSLNNYLELRYNCLDIDGVIKYKTHFFNNFNELINFMNTNTVNYNYFLSFNSLKHQYDSLRSKIKYKNKNVLYFQEYCYLRGENIEGVPIVNDLKRYSYPIFNNNYFFIKIVILINLKNGIYISDLFKIYCLHVKKYCNFPLIKDISIFYKIDFKRYIIILKNNDYIKITHGKIFLLRSIFWFSDYFDRLSFLTKNK